MIAGDGMTLSTKIDILRSSSSSPYNTLSHNAYGWETKNFMHYEKYSVPYLSHIVTNVTITGCCNVAKYVVRGTGDLGRQGMHLKWFVWHGEALSDEGKHRNDKDVSVG